MIYDPDIPTTDNAGIWNYAEETLGAEIEED